APGAHLGNHDALGGKAALDFTNGFQVRECCKFRAIRSTVAEPSMLSRQKRRILSFEKHRPTESQSVLPVPSHLGRRLQACQRTRRAKFHSRTPGDVHSIPPRTTTYCSGTMSSGEAAPQAASMKIPMIVLQIPGINEPKSS